MSEQVSVFEAQVRGEVDMQIATAKAYPRNVQKFRDGARAMALSTAEVAASCMYALPRKDSDGKKKTIKGASVRFAEILAANYGNCRLASRIIDTDGKHVTAQAVFSDVENNVARSAETKRRITNSQGQRYNDDMVMTTANAAAAIASRNVVLSAIPEAVWGPIYDEACAKAVGKGTTSFDEKRKALVALLAKSGATLDRVLHKFDVESENDLDAEMCMELEALRQAIRDGGCTVDDAFPAPGAEPEAEKPAKGLAGLQQKLGAEA